jgi:hypothetical protein
MKYVGSGAAGWSGNCPFSVSELPKDMQKIKLITNHHHCRFKMAKEIQKDQETWLALSLLVAEHPLIDQCRPMLIHFHKA